MKKTLALFSSARRNGNTLRLLKQLQQVWELDIVFLDDYRIHSYDYLHRNSQDQFQSLIDRVLEYDRILFASPVYWSSVTPQMKAFFDRLSDLLDVESYKDKGRALRGKETFVLCTSIQSKAPKTFTSMFKEIFKYLGMDYKGVLHADCSQGFIAEKYQRDVENFRLKQQCGWQQQILKTLSTMAAVK